MELFGFSAAKIITILIIAVVIFGPAQVAEMVKTVGRTIRDVRRYLNDMTKEFNDATGGLREEFAGIAQDLRGGVGGDAGRSAQPTGSHRHLRRDYRDRDRVARHPAGNCPRRGRPAPRLADLTWKHRHADNSRRITRDSRPGG